MTKCGFNALKTFQHHSLFNGLDYFSGSGKYFRTGFSEENYEKSFFKVNSGYKGISSSPIFDFFKSNFVPSTTCYKKSIGVLTSGGRNILTIKRFNWILQVNIYRFPPSSAFSIINAFGFTTVHLREVVVYVEILPKILVVVFANSSV